jgi:hypothetical protein
MTRKTCPRPARLLLPLLCAAATSLTAGSGPSFAQPQAPPLRDCIGSSNGASWTPMDDHSIVARSDGRAYLVTTGRCPRLTQPLARIVVESNGGGPICNPHDVRLYVSGPDRIRTPCFIQSIRPLSPDEAKALRRP